MAPGGGSPDNAVLISPGCLQKCRMRCDSQVPCSQAAVLLLRPAQRSQPGAPPVTDTKKASSSSQEKRKHNQQPHFKYIMVQRKVEAGV